MAQSWPVLFRLLVLADVPLLIADVHVVVPCGLLRMRLPVANTLFAFVTSALKLAKVPEPLAATAMTPIASSSIRYCLIRFLSMGASAP